MFIQRAPLRVLALLVISLGARVSAQNLTDDQISLVKARLAQGATHSWELGTRAQALVELDTPTFSVYNASVPPPRTAPSSLNETLAIAQSIVANRSASNHNATGPQPLIQDGAAADPASNIFEVVLANWTGLSDHDYAGAAKDQVDFLFDKVPKTSDGAISHRADQLQLWSDFVYMVPPTLAYYGVITGNQSMVQFAYNQVKLYRNYLIDTHANNLWKHVLMGSFNDTGHWSTGNGWAAAGMLRVAATIQNSPFSSALKNQHKDLLNWAHEIHGGMYRHLDTNTSLFHNYADNPSTFLDASSTAILAASVYRLANMGGPRTHIPQAELSRKALSSTNSSGAFVHFDAQGWLTPVVNPDSYGSEGSKSPEGQAFVLQMHAAWQDWVALGEKGAFTCASL
ncbi:Six-hairpin glycosidase [Punctularia strigosozonata HHB-11173 SS5]|uniref:Six-hairpin glycosidase n=1 Tax=Punctularia strigosozonata (strain HHB-11173) TaxID=741275 RepID=R7S1C6_PUNST|nr:Six-hairpin glycosidase [Punctularia strigosozonata HHB-11173 SS5]EIN04180.1 Six-hairpin glycosidase [Punctularia strigosozonata HHB-11173 SS5]